MKTRKTKRKGGFLGIRALKTRTENRDNCHRLAENFKKRDDFLYRKYKCAIKSSPECHVIGRYSGLHRECSDENIDVYDFSRDGQHVKQRIQPFFGSDKVPLFTNRELWNEMPFHFKKRPNSLGEYDLKTEDEIQEYKN